MTINDPYEPDDFKECSLDELIKLSVELEAYSEVDYNDGTIKYYISNGKPNRFNVEDRFCIGYIKAKRDGVTVYICKRVEKF